MAFVPAPNIVMVEPRALFDGQKIEHRFMFDVLTPVTDLLVESAAQIVDEWYVNVYNDRLPAGVVYTETVATDMSDVNGPQHSISPSTPLAGAITGNAMPNEVTCCISLRTSSRGRSARGRAFALGLPASAVTGNVISNAHLSYLVSGFEDLLTRVVTEGWSWCVVSYIANNAPRPGGPVYFPITNVLVVDNIVDSMRRRKPGVGQ